MEPNWLVPSPKMWRARLVQLALVGGGLMIAVGVGLGLGVGATAAVGGLAVVLGVTGVFAALVRRRYRAWGYAEREDDLLVRRGLLVRRLTVVPYGRMQFVDVTAGPIDRMFGLATVQLHTAASATDARIPGLLNAEAERLRDQLASHGEAKATGL